MFVILNHIIIFIIRTIQRITRPCAQRVTLGLADPSLTLKGVLLMTQGTFDDAARFSSVNIWWLRQQDDAKVPYF